MKLRAKIETWLEKVDMEWRELPVMKQYKRSVYCFLGCQIITMAVILKGLHNEGKSNNSLAIEHIENPVVKKKEPAITLQDSLIICFMK